MESEEKEETDQRKEKRCGNRRRWELKIKEPKKKGDRNRNRDERRQRQLK